MPTQRISITGHDGSELAARLDLPEGPVCAHALFAHCFTCGKDIAAARRIASRLNASGIAVMRFDFTGLGHSKGEFANTSFSTNVADLTRVAAHMSEIGRAPTLLIGHSLGGAAVLRAATEIPGIKAVATIGAPFDPGHVVHNFEDALPEIARDGAADVTLGGRQIRLGQTFVEDVSQASLTEALRQLKAALLVLHAPRDATVSIDNAAEIFLAAKHPKSFVTLDDADHLVTRAEDAEYAADVIASWAARYLDLAAPEPRAETPEGIVRASEADADGFLQDIQSGPHHMLADEPVAFGGTHQGPSPYGLVSAGLAACTSMTIRMYARRKGWPLAHVSVDVSHAKTHAADSEAGQKIDTWSRAIRLEGDLDETQRARLLEIADKCPVHRTLEASSRIETALLPAT